MMKIFVQIAHDLQITQEKENCNQRYIHERYYFSRIQKVSLGDFKRIS